MDHEIINKKEGKLPVQVDINNIPVFDVIYGCLKKKQELKKELEALEKEQTMKEGAYKLLVDTVKNNIKGGADAKESALI